MKTRKELKLRPLRPAFLDVIPRLPAMICKKEILFKAFSPITYVFSSVKGIFKKRSANNISRRRQQCATQVSGDEQDEGESSGNQRKTCLKSGIAKNNLFKEQWTMTESKRPTLIKANITACEEIICYNKWPLTKELTTKTPKGSTCLSCQEDRAAYETCGFCQRLKSSLPSSSCSDCQARGPVVKFCMRFHGKQPKIFITKNLDIYKKFTSKRILPNRLAVGECNGKSPSIYNCPVCLTLWPTMGECNCRSCRNSQPIVKFSLPKYSSPAKVHLCPCSHCSHLHPKIKICDLCRGTNSRKLVRSNSFYMMLS